MLELLFYLLFAIGLLGFLWPYLFYPLIISLLSRFVKKPVCYDSNFRPSITVLIPCYNEERVIESKIRNTLELDYPKDRLQIIVIDSGSKDATSEIAKRFKEVKLLVEDERHGKGSAINLALDYAIGEVIVVTDADAYLAKDALSVLGKCFSDPKVGIVGGKVLAKQISSASKEGTSFLRAYEDFLSEKETCIDSTVNLGGELLAIRANLARVDELSLAEDFDCILNARSKGYRVILDSLASAWEYAPVEKSEIVVQKKRVMIGGLQCLYNYRHLIFNPRYGFFGLLILPSHKLLQLVNNFMLLLVFFSSFAVYLLTANTLMLLFLILETSFLLLSIFSYFAKLNFTPFIQMRYFILIQYSLFGAWGDFILRRYSVKWERITSKRLPEKQINV
jgi:biofilm PGA synthesis N-glycosyltransferase PgaC